MDKNVSISLCPFPIWYPLVLCFFLCSFLPFEPLFWMLFLLGQSASLCTNSPQYPQHPLNTFLAFFIGLAHEEGIIIFLFVPARNIFHCLIFVFQNLFNFWKFYIPFLSLSFISSMAPSYSDCAREFNKWVMNTSSSILCPVFANSVQFFSKNANQSIGFCLVFSSL